MSSDAWDDEVLICRCQEITLGEVRAAIRGGAKDLRQVKGQTEAMMGLCQGRTCRRQIIGEIAGIAGVDPAQLLARRSRPPVRPISLQALAAEKDEP